MNIETMNSISTINRYKLSNFYLKVIKTWINYTRLNTETPENQITKYMHWGNNYGKDKGKFVLISEFVILKFDEKKYNENLEVFVLN